MSGARPAWGSDEPDPNEASLVVGAADARDPPNRWPASRATTASMAMAATAHGRVVAVPRESSVADGRVPAAVPQRWQKWAPGESSDRQPAQIASATAAPHSEQNRPVVGAEQFGQGRVGVVDDMPQN